MMIFNMQINLIFTKKKRFENPLLKPLSQFKAIVVPRWSPFKIMYVKPLPPSPMAAITKNRNVLKWWGRHDRDHMVVRFTITYAIGAYHH
jgi:hypothetical protein